MAVIAVVSGTLLHNKGSKNVFFSPPAIHIQVTQHSSIECAGMIDVIPPEHSKQMLIHVMDTANQGYQ